MDGIHDALKICMIYGISLLVFDFEGAGHSEGEFISLGVREVTDVDLLVKFACSIGFGKIVLWGRSMGAVASCLYASKTPLPCLKGVILDSPYCNLRELVKSIIDRLNSKVISSIASTALPRLRNQIMSKVPELDIFAFDVSQVALSCQTPALIFHAENDDFVPPIHSRRVFDAYGSQYETVAKQYTLIKGSHNTTRGPDIFDRISEFLFDRILPSNTCFEQFLHFVPKLLNQPGWSNYVAKPLKPVNDILNSNEHLGSVPESHVQEHSDDDEQIDKFDSSTPQTPKGRTLSPFFELIVILPEYGILTVYPYTGTTLTEKEFISFDRISSVAKRNLVFMDLRESPREVFWSQDAEPLCVQFSRCMDAYVEKRLIDVGPERVLANLPNAILQLVDSNLSRHGRTDSFTIQQTMTKTLKEMIGFHKSDDEIKSAVDNAIHMAVLKRTGEAPRFRKPLFKRRRHSKKKCTIM